MNTKTKLCPCCHTKKPESDFYINKKRKDIGRKKYTQGWCKQCAKIKAKEWLHSNAGIKWLHEHSHARSLWFNYKITEEEYERMLKRQNGVCAICKRADRTKITHTKKILCVDHDHATDKIRGLLCRYCNAHLDWG